LTAGHDVESTVAVPEAISTPASLAGLRVPITHQGCTLTDPSMSSGATFYTVSDAAYFPGTVALLNSLRLTGNGEELIVLDNGLTGEQRRRLAGHATVVDLPDTSDKHPYTLKPFPFLVGATGVVVLIDSDMIVTASLEPTIRRAEAGRICLFPDDENSWDRWFPDWQRQLSLTSPPRRQIYLNSGFLAFSTDRWPGLLKRWWNACAMVPSDLVGTTEDNPFAQTDQDVLNAILMSEIEQDDLAILPYKGEAHPDAQGVVIEDATRLICSHDGEQLAIAHHALAPKMWSSGGWKRMQTRHPYVRLFPRVVFAEDVTLRLTARDVPWWLWPRFGCRAALNAYLLSRRVARPAVDWARRLRSALRP
jgi:hypothetical protein